MSVNSEKLRTPSEAREALRAYGITVAAFARHLNVSENSVKEVLARKVVRAKGSFGAAHIVMVALGMKAAPPGQQALDLSTLDVSRRMEKKTPNQEVRHAQAA